MAAFISGDDYNQVFNNSPIAMLIIDTDAPAYTILNVNKAYLSSIVLLSASKYIERSAIEAGADDFLAKPFEIAELLGKIQKYITS